MKKNLKLAALCAVPFAILCLTLTTVASEKEFAIYHEEPHWILSADSSMCNPEVTGRVCAEWGDSQQMYGVSCCISPLALGTSDSGACEELINGQLGFMPNRVSIE